MDSGSSAINNEQLIINNYPCLKEGDWLKGKFLIYPLKRGGFKAWIVEWIINLLSTINS